MRLTTVAASIFAISMASAAFAQSNPAPAGSTIDKSTIDSGGGGTTDTQNNTGAAPMVADPNTTNSTIGNTNSSGTVDRSRCPAQAAPGTTAAQGGNSGASESQACPDTDSQ